MPLVAHALGPLVAHSGRPDEVIAEIMIFAAIAAAWIGWSRMKGRRFERLPRWLGVGVFAAAPVLAVGAIVVPYVILRPPAPAAVPPTSTATVAFVKPAPGEHVAGSTMEVEIRLTGGHVVDTTTTDVTPDAGHLHVYLDGAMVSMTYADALQVPIEDLSIGTHELRAEFVAVDHAPFDPPVTASVTFVKDG